MNARFEISTELFASLRAGQTVRVVFSGCMSCGDVTLTVGRRSMSKKYNTESLTLLPVDGRKVSPMAAFKLYHRVANGNVSLAQGDMATMVESFTVVS